MPLVTKLRMGERAMIVRFEDECIANKLISMGMMPGAELEMVRTAPFGGGFYVKIDGINLALRSNEAQKIVVG